MTDTLQRLKTTLADRYRRERERGQGGMATACPAADVRHHGPPAAPHHQPPRDSAEAASVGTLL